jgi:cyanate lyase
VACALPAHPASNGKDKLVKSLLKAKEKSGKTFTQIAKEVGLTNVYTTQLFYNQVQWMLCAARVMQPASSSQWLNRVRCI